MKCAARPPPALSNASANSTALRAAIAQKSASFPCPAALVPDLFCDYPPAIGRCMVDYWLAPARRRCVSRLAGGCSGSMERYDTDAPSTSEAQKSSPAFHPLWRRDDRPNTQLVASRKAAVG